MRMMEGKKYPLGTFSQTYDGILKSLKDDRFISHKPLVREMPEDVTLTYFKHQFEYIVFPQRYAHALVMLVSRKMGGVLSAGCIFP